MKGRTEKAKMKEGKGEKREMKRKRESAQASFPVGSDQGVEEKLGFFLHQADVGWTPTGIVALAATGDGCYVAAARESGALELYETLDVFPNFSLVKVIPGREGAGISSLVWVKGQKGAWRLLSGGLDGHVVEWDFETLDVKTLETSHGGAVWGMAMKESREGEQLVATACDDGSVRVFGVEREGGIVLKGSLMSDSERCLCVAWEREGDRLVSGHADGSIRIWETDALRMGSAGREIQKITLPQSTNKGNQPPTKGKKQESSEQKKAPEERYGSVWCLLFLKGSIVSGDSEGRVLFWDAQFGSLLFEFHKHKADVTALAASHDGNAVLASGVDVRIAVFQLLQPRHGRRQWVYSHAKRPHTHDVRSLLTFRQGEAEYLVSGGQDAQLQWVSAMRENVAQRFLEVRMQRVLKSPEANKHQVLNLGKVGNRVLISSGQRTVDILGLHGDPDESCREKPDDEELASHENTRHLARVKMEDEAHLLCCRASPDGRFLATSSRKQLKLMRVNGLSDLQNPAAADGNVWGSSESRLSIKPVRVEGAKPAVCLAFSSDSSLMYAADTSNCVSVVNLATRKIETQLDVEQPSSSKGDRATKLSPIKNWISAMEVAKNGKWLACTVHDRIHLFDLMTGQFHTTIGSGRQVACATFDPSSSFLVVVEVDKLLTVYDAQTGSITEWSKEHPTVTKLNDTWGQMLGAAFIPDNGNVLLLYTERSCCYVTFSRPSRSPHGGKRPRIQGDGPGANSRVVHCRGVPSILHVDFMGPGAAMMVRGDWKRVLESLPPPLYRVRYGIS